MLNILNKSKYNKIQRGRLKGNFFNKFKLNFGKFGIQSLEPKWLTSKQIESFLKVIKNNTKKIEKFWIKVFINKPITKKTIQSRMGSGKGSVEYWVTVIKPGSILLEFDSTSKEIAIKIYKKVSYKLPFKTKFLFKK